MVRYVERARGTDEWIAIAARLRRVEGFEPMAELVAHIAAAPYAARLFGATSMHTLFIAQTPEIFDHQEVVHVDYDHMKAELVITCHERGPRLDMAMDDPIARRVPPPLGIAATERLLSARGWI